MEELELENYEHGVQDGLVIGIGLRTEIELSIRAKAGIRVWINKIITHEDQEKNGIRIEIGKGVEQETSIRIGKGLETGIWPGIGI